jgi:hypothetical protein
MSRMAGKAGEAPDGSKRQAGRSTPPNKRLWSAGIKTISTFPPGGIFAERAEKIAETMARPEVSPGGLGGAIRMVTYFANRAGRNLPKERLAELERAKRLLRDRKAAAPVTPHVSRARAGPAARSCLDDAAWRRPAPDRTRAGRLAVSGASIAVRRKI